MTNRWQVLALLFSIRVAMAFQFQAVAALSPFFMEAYKIGIADIGLLIGLYLSPGIFLALPGGAIGKRFGEKQVVLAGLLLMCVGGLMVAIGSTWELQLAGRVIAGVGGVLLNVLMTKMVTDWFAGREIATAMGIFVNSWPVGIALALLVLPGLADATGLNMALLMVAVPAICGFALLATAYEAPAGLNAQDTQPVPLRGTTLWLVICAGLIWGLYNAALSMVFSFAPAMLAEQGWTATAASSVTSIVLWVMAISIPLGGILADRTKRVDTVLMTGLILFAIMLIIAARTDAILLSFTIMGAVAGLSAGPIMSLPSRILLAGNRAIGMGVFFTIFYMFVVLGPLAAGYLADLSGRISIAFDIGTLMLIACIVLLMIFRHQTSTRKQASIPYAAPRSTG
ncbi:CynX/NimT family MFS transporter [Pararhizobium sp. IMCC21322]|uniref:MFS transporter n=1 Tax=Pararhizobium sp. IMCC21322 TaxID=3067903 RepID=UPI00274104EB|nr:MFS transporter [Pararhizobium sp. IMCC21322]